MKLPPARIAAFIKAPDAGMRAALVYGPDSGLVKERAEKIARAVCPDLTDAFRVAEIDADALPKDPARLHDEAASLSLMGGRRLVRIQDAGDNVGAIFARFFKDPPPGDAFIVVAAGDLPPRSSLRRAFEAAKNAAAIACYLDGPRELGELAREIFTAHKITARPEAMQYLVSHLGGDRGISRQELEKLALYVGDGGTVDETAAFDAVGDSAELTTDEAVFAAAEGDAAQLERALNRAFGEGAQAVSLIRAELRHFQRLHLAGARHAAGKSEDEALKFRPPLFFKFVDRFKRQLRLWPPARAEAAMTALNEAEARMKTTGLPAETICREALLRIARGAAAAARAR
ncbi:MAG TPA: DNA polymerase III subunit delta [Stellaceae bacterium]|jgi:DNA polymerase-3 subunit delta|nr:DNA polymerase III subunit delta [Stellaceae bacterium]